MAQPPGITAVFGKKTQVYGMLRLRETQVQVEIFVGSHKVEDHVIDCASWTAS